jgi:hypothetical protein
VGRAPTRVIAVVAALVASSFGCAACRPDLCAGARPSEEPRAPLHGLFAHAHNDYEHAHPLDDALAAHFNSVEADVWLDDNGVVQVSHSGAPYKGTLQALYLDPLAARVAKSGSVYGDGAAFVLWIDIKDGSRALQDALRSLLARYPPAFLARSFDDHNDAGAVSVILTGDGAAKHALARTAAPRSFTRDEGSIHVDDPPADLRWSSYALSWSSYVAWNGEGEIDGRDRERLLCLVDRAHATGRTVRLYATPDVPAVWRALQDAGADFINTDDLAGLSSFLARR